ncbi:MAG TPA: anthranilate phosphoribosyltransferase [Candidatus Acidoferrales bacterium]|nr:anthranilate phosphoribosyltransferase [Candidatus Acidoferrales bacterium]
MSDFSALLRGIVAGEPLEADVAYDAIGSIIDTSWTPVQAGAFLVALAAKGETASEIAGAARAFRERSLHVEHDLPLVLDTCGTGGDGAGTINVSTIVGLVVAGCGVPVAKHGNRASSSRCGSADVLEALGIAIDDDPAMARVRLEHDGFTFMFAPRYHPAMKAVSAVRRELGIRTLFNLLGPLCNPARATHQVVGVAKESHLELVGDALIALGTQGGAVVYAASGIDEIAGEGPTYVYQFSAQRAWRYVIDPSDFGIRAPLGAIAGGEPALNAAAVRAILEGERSPRADVVALNAALALVVSERAGSFREGLDLAQSSLQDGAGLAVLEALRRPIKLEFA